MATWNANELNWARQNGVSLPATRPQGGLAALPVYHQITSPTRSSVPLPPTTTPVNASPTWNSSEQAWLDQYYQGADPTRSEGGLANLAQYWEWFYGDRGGSGGGTPAPSYAPAPVQTAWQQKTDDTAAKSAQLLTEAYDYGLNKLREDMAYYGYNPDDYTTQISRYLGQIQESIPEGDLSPKQYYQGDIYNPFKTGYEQDQINSYQNQLNQFLSPGFATDMFDEYSGEGVINDILGKQYTTASDAIQRAQDRGMLNPQGYDYAMGELGTARGTGYSTLDKLRDSLVEQNRQQLRDRATRERDRLSTYQMGDTFDVGKIQGDINNYYKGLSTGFGDSLRNAFGGQQLFDWNKYTQSGGINQGPTGSNLTAPMFLSSLQDREKNESTYRGVGTEGVF